MNRESQLAVILCAGVGTETLLAQDIHPAEEISLFETHSKKKGTDIQVGDIVTLEGGFGKSFLEGALTIGLAFDAQWKVTEDDPGELQPIFDLLELGKHRVYGARFVSQHLSRRLNPFGSALPNPIGKEIS